MKIFNSLYFLILFTALPSFAMTTPKNIDNSSSLLSAGGNHTCALDDDGVKCWGDNTEDQAPKLKSDLRNPRQISAGYKHTCALDDDGVKCWGMNLHEQAPKFKSDLKNPRQISAGTFHTCALDDDGVKCWGDNSEGQAPKFKSDLKNPRQVSAGDYHTCALDDDGVKCWGLNDSGQAPEFQSDFKNPRKISVEDFHSCAIDDDGVKCWGMFLYGQVHKFKSDLKNPRQISADLFHICAPYDEGIKCWGMNLYQAPIFKSDLKNPRQISAGRNQICALYDYGVKCWAYNEEKQLEIPELSFGPVFKKFQDTPEFLSKLSDHVYSFDRDYFLNLAQVLKSFNLEGPALKLGPSNIPAAPLLNIFSMNALYPFFQDFGYPELKQNYILKSLSRLENQNASLGLPSSGAKALSQLESTRQIRTLAFQMLALSFKSSMKLLSQEDQSKSADFVQELSSVIAEGASLNSTQKFLNNNGSKLRAHLAKLALNPYLRARTQTDLQI